MTGVTLNNLTPNSNLQPTDLIPDLPAGALEMQSITVAQLTAAAVAAEAPVIASLSTGVASLSTVVSSGSGAASLSTVVSSLSTSTSTSEAGLSTGVASLSTGLISLSTSTSTSEAGLSSGLSTVEGEISSLSTSEASLSTGLAASNTLITSLSTAVAGTSVHFYSVDDTTPTDGNYANDGASGAGALAAGVDAVASHTHDTAVGYGATASGGSSLALGEGASASGPQTTAVGYGAKAGYYSAALGTGANASGFASAAVGPANANGSQTVAIGQDATANPTFSTALGALAGALANEGDVALGWDATTTTVVATGSAIVSGTTYSGFAGVGPTCTVSIGNGSDGAGGERTLTNLAAGRITAASTDAVNGSQLYAVAAAQTQGYTVATLPAGAEGMRAYVTDAVSPAFLAPLTGGGTALSPAIYLGGQWVAG